MTLHVLQELEQGSPAWHDARRGIITASTIGRLITPKTLKPAANPESRSLTAQLVAERITGHTDATYINGDMMRGTLDEPLARDAYAKHTGTHVEQVGFQLRDDWGFNIGYSPDGLVNDDGLLEIKSRLQKKQLLTVLDPAGIPIENMAQIQTALLVSGRDWCDFVSYSGGMELWIKRVHPDPKWFDAILATVRQFEDTAALMVAQYKAAVAGLPLTERIDHFADQEMSF